MKMAPGVCVTSFRMLFLRRPDLCHLNTSLRFNPYVATVIVNVNDWSFGRRRLSYHHHRSYNTSSSGSSGDHKGKSQINTEPKCPQDTEESDDVDDAIPPVITQEKKLNFAQSKVTELRSQLRALGLTTTGSKQVLIERLKKYEELHRENSEKNTKIIKTSTSSSASSSSSSSSDDDVVVVYDNDNDVQKKSPPSTSTSIATLKDATPSYADEQITPMPPMPPPTTTLSTPQITINHHHHRQQHQTPSKRSDVLVHSSPGSTVLFYDDVIVEYIQGLPHITVPLPSRNELCRFALKPVSHKVGDFIQMLKSEDRGIDRATILNQNGVRISSTCNIESLMDEEFWLHINDKKYKVSPPQRDRLPVEDLNRLGDIRALVAQLYEALHVGEYHIHKENELLTRLEDLKYRVEPLEKQQLELHDEAVRKTNMMTWVGLGLMSVQFGILARLTWWEYSWDIMEPVTYFVTYGTAMAMYAYYCITKTEYNLPEVKDRQYLLTLHKRAKKKNFDIDEYNTLKRQIAEIEYNLRRLRDPINLQLPPHVERSQENPPIKPGPEALVEKIRGEKKLFKLPFLEKTKP